MYYYISIIINATLFVFYLVIQNTVGCLTLKLFCAYYSKGLKTLILSCILFVFILQDHGKMSTWDYIGKGVKEET